MIIEKDLAKELNSIFLKQNKNCKRAVSKYKNKTYKYDKQNFQLRFMNVCKLI